MSSRPPRVLITGVAGFIGSQLAAELSANGYDVDGIDSLSHGERRNLVRNGQEVCRFTKADIRDSDLLQHMQNVDFVFHLAAISSLATCQTDPREAISVNVAGTANVLEAARRSGVRRVIFASTSAIYENNSSFPCSEQDQVSPSLIYPLTKWQAEQVCKSFVDNYGYDVTITRYYNVYGLTRTSSGNHLHLSDTSYESSCRAIARDSTVTAHNVGTTSILTTSSP